MSYSESAIRELTKAVPTINADGKVVKWELELTYSLNGYTVKFPSTVEIDFDLKKPNEFTISELKNFARQNHWNAVYDSMYESTQLPSPPATTTVVSNFNLSSLND